MNAVLTDEQAPLAPGAQLLPGYRVRGHLRRGRPYDVYEVFCERRRCSCIAKTPRPAAASDPNVAAQLLEEGTRLAGLSHPHLVQVYELVEFSAPAVIMETLGGETLKFMIHDRGRPIAFAGLVHMGLQLCSALGYIHRNGLLHLDLKPSNIVNDRGRVKLLDLSLARPPGPGPRCGTHTYLPPEQAVGGDYTAANDAWGIGVVLFEAITAQVPFPGSASGGHRQLVERRTVPAEHHDRVPPAMVTLVNACLDPVAGQRPALGELEALLESLV